MNADSAVNSPAGFHAILLPKKQQTVFDVQFWKQICLTHLQSYEHGADVDGEVKDSNHHTDDQVRLQPLVLHVGKRNTNVGDCVRNQGHKLTIPYKYPTNVVFQSNKSSFISV